MLVHLQKACAVVVVEQGKRIILVQVSVGEFDAKSEEDVASRTQEMEDTLVAFTETDFANHLHLASLDMAGLCSLCQEARSDGSCSGPNSTPGDK